MNVRPVWRGQRRCGDARKGSFHQHPTQGNTRAAGVMRGVAGSFVRVGRQMDAVGLRAMSRPELAGVAILGDLSPVAKVVLGIGLVGAMMAAWGRWRRGYTLTMAGMAAEDFGKILPRTTGVPSSEDRAKLKQIGRIADDISWHIIGFGDRHIAIALMGAEALYLAGDAGAAATLLRRVAGRVGGMEGRAAEAEYLACVADTFAQYKEYGIWGSDVFERVAEGWAAPSQRQLVRALPSWLAERYASLGVPIASSVYERIGEKLQVELSMGR